MNKDIAQTDDLRPGHARKLVLHGLENSPGGLSDDLQVVDYPNLKHFVALETIGAGGDSLFDFRGRREYVAEAIRAAPHKGTASR